MLGPLEVLDDGRPLDLGAPRQRALLAFLLLHANEVVSSDRLAEALWPEDMPRTAAKAIQVYVSPLRKALGSARDVLETRGSGYVLRVGARRARPARVRAAARERDETRRPRRVRRRCAEALALWRGAPLSDFEYESFVQPEAARLGELRQLALEERIEAELELGGGPELVAELQALVGGATAAGAAARAAHARAVPRRAPVRGARGVPRGQASARRGARPRARARSCASWSVRSSGRTRRSRTAPAPEAPLRAIVAVPESAAGLDALAPAGRGARARPDSPGARARPDRPGRGAVGCDGRSSTRARRDLAQRGATVRVAAFSSSVACRGRGAARGRSRMPICSCCRPTATRSPGRLRPVFERGHMRRRGARRAWRRGSGRTDRRPVRSVRARLGRARARRLGRGGSRASAAADRGGGRGARGRDASRLLADASLIVQHASGVVAEPLLGRPGREGVAALAEGAGLLVRRALRALANGGARRDPSSARRIASGADRARPSWAASGGHRAAGDA